MKERFSMDSLIAKTRDLLSSGTADVVIGYGKGSVKERTRALFITKPEKADQLIYNEYCTQNLAVYLTKNEVLHHYKKIAIVAPKQVLRSVLQLASEEQVFEQKLIILGINENGLLIELNGYKAVEDYLAGIDHNISDQEKAAIEKLDAMSLEERWQFWEKELSKCIKCYACRQACPMCYCNRCMVECNQPQWVHVPAHGLGNLEWHFMRAMHLAGRCVNCGDCAKACPMEIPLNLLTYKLIEPIKNDFNAIAGLQAKMESVLSSYKVSDKESFIR